MKMNDKNIGVQTGKIVEDTLAKEQQSQKDLSKFIYLFGLLGPLLALFQAWKIFSLATAAGVSLLYWTAYLIVAAMWFGYGIYSKNKPIMIVYGLWVFVEIIILNGIFYYRGL